MAGKSSLLAAIMPDPKGLVISAVIMLQGCSGSALKEEGPASVTSNPSGAEVYANGEKLGVTPLHYKLYKAFPAGWENWVVMTMAPGAFFLLGLAIWISRSIQEAGSESEE